MKKKMTFIIPLVMILFLAAYITHIQENEESMKAEKETTTKEENKNQEETAKQEQTSNQEQTPDTALTRQEVEASFQVQEISDEIYQRINGISYRDNDNISLSELRYLQVLYYGFDGKTHVGELIVNQAISEDILDIMRTLYDNHYPIEKMVLVDEYQGDDVKSMEDNNTSSFNYRTIAGSSRLSRHSLGMAIDINPRYNPYVTTSRDGTVNCSPLNGQEYVNRSQDFLYKIDEEDLCYQLFIAHGFTWGGSWNSSKDYQHFEK